MKKNKPEIDKILGFSSKRLKTLNTKPKKKKNNSRKKSAKIDIDSVFSNMMNSLPKQPNTTPPNISTKQPSTQPQQPTPGLNEVLKKKNDNEKIEIHNHYYGATADNTTNKFPSITTKPSFSVLNGEKAEDKKPRDPNKPLKTWEKTLRSIYESDSDD